MDIAPAILSRLGPREIARAIEIEDPETAARVFNHLDHTKARRVLRQLSEEGLEKLIEGIGPKRFADILAHMKDAEAVRILRKIGKEKRAEIIKNLPKREKTVYSFLLHYSKDVAGGWMRVDVLRVKPKESALAIRKELKKWDGYSRHIIVETEGGVFFGVIPVEMLLSAPRTARAEDLAIDAETVDIDTDSEEVARLFTQYSPEIAVVLDDGKVLGIITAQEAIHLIEKEHAEDVAKIFSMREIEHVWTPVRKAIKNRTPWLIVNLFTAFLAASVVSIFETTIRTFALLAVFMPIVPGEAGNATTQTMAIVVRGLATGELDKTALRRVFWKEFVLGLLNGAVVGAIAFAFALVWKENLLVALALALAMPLALIVAGLIGVAIPIILKKLGQDPASSSTIILTTFTDIVGFFTFLGIATVLMRVMGI